VMVVCAKTLLCVPSLYVLTSGPPEEDDTTLRQDVSQAHHLARQSERADDEEPPSVSKTDEERCGSTEDEG
jgi:hypothetical protein